MMCLRSSWQVGLSQADLGDKGFISDNTTWKRESTIPAVTKSNCP